MKTSTLTSVFETITDRDSLTEKARACGAFERQSKVHSYDFVLALLRAGCTGPFRTIASVRRTWEALTGKTIAPSSFDEHFNPGMVKLLWEMLGDLMRPARRALRRSWPSAVQALRDILICDGTRMALPKGLAKVFRGTEKEQAAIKILGLLSMGDNLLTDARVGAAVHHDRKLLRLGELVAGALYLLDLGFYDHSLFVQYDTAEAKFVSRLKQNAMPTIVAVDKGVRDARHAAGRPLDDVQRYGHTVDVDAAFSAPGEPGGQRTFRVVKVKVGRTDRHDHWQGDHVDCWYVTNLDRATWSPEMISAIYRLRWAIERAFRQMKDLARLDHLRTERPVVAFIFLASSLLLWMLGAAIVRELEKNRGVGQVSHDRVFACLIEAMPDIARSLARPTGAPDLVFQGLAAIFEQEGRHPNPSQPRRVTTVFDTIESQTEILKRAA